MPELASHIPVVKTGNHLRVVVVLMLCLALLAGWGLDELTAERIPPHATSCSAWRSALLVLPVLVLAARGDLSAGRSGAR